MMQIWTSSVERLRSQIGHVNGLIPAIDEIPTIADGIDGQRPAHGDVRPVHHRDRGGTPNMETSLATPNNPFPIWFHSVAS
jgi:hypothetical protein